MSGPTDEIIREETARIQRIINEPVAAGQGPSLRPRNASTLVIVDRSSSSSPRVLMGRRHKAMKFMPGALVFPGGAVDRTDGAIAAAEGLPEATREKIMRNLRARPTGRAAHALGMAAIRETAEETGLLIGTRGTGAIRRPEWSSFNQNGISPSLANFSLLARAITPPGRSRRYDTWFFVVDANAIGHVPEQGFESNGELEELEWIRPEDAMAGPTRDITRLILTDLLTRLRHDRNLDPEYPAPFYSAPRLRFTRVLL